MGEKSAGEERPAAGKAPNEKLVHFDGQTDISDHQGSICRDLAKPPPMNASCQFHREPVHMWIQRNTYQMAVRSNCKYLGSLGEAHNFSEDARLRRPSRRALGSRARCSTLPSGPAFAEVATQNRTLRILGRQPAQFPAIRSPSKSLFNGGRNALIRELPPEPDAIKSTFGRPRLSPTTFRNDPRSWRPE